MTKTTKRRRYDSTLGETTETTTTQKGPVRRFLEVVLTGKSEPVVTERRHRTRKQVRADLRAAGQELVLPSRKDGTVDFRGED